MHQSGRDVTAPWIRLMPPLGHPLHALDGRQRFLPEGPRRPRDHMIDPDEPLIDRTEDDRGL